MGRQVMGMHSIKRQVSDRHRAKVQHRQAHDEHTHTHIRCTMSADAVAAADMSITVCLMGIKQNC